MKYIIVPRTIFEMDKTNYRKFEVVYPMFDYEVTFYFEVKDGLPNFNELPNQTINLTSVVKYSVRSLYDNIGKKTEYYMLTNEFKKRVHHIEKNKV